MSAPVHELPARSRPGHTWPIVGACILLSAAAVLAGTAVSAGRRPAPEGSLVPGPLPAQVPWLLLAVTVGGVVVAVLVPGRSVPLAWRSRAGVAWLAVLVLGAVAGVIDAAGVATDAPLASRASDPGLPLAVHCSAGRGRRRGVTRAERSWTLRRSPGHRGGHPAAARGDPGAVRRGSCARSAARGRGAHRCARRDAPGWPCDGGGREGSEEFSAGGVIQRGTRLVLVLPMLATVFESEATFRADGSCRLMDALEGTQRSWPSVTAWAADWFSEWRTGEHGDASAFAGVACDDAVPGVVGALVVLAKAADGDADLIAWVGAGPVEDLLSHSGNGLRVLDEVDRAAHRHPAFRAALRTVVLGDDMPEPVVARLAELTAPGPHEG